MNFTQNDRLKQVTSDTLVVGVDVGSKTHFCRAFDWRGFELSRRVFKFSNTGIGFLTFLRWLEEIMRKSEMKKSNCGLRAYRLLLAYISEVPAGTRSSTCNS
ncbi:hypothetical protein [Blautia producta]|uniref:hypothetical protein n=1 Tax=Blautia producta TaxID=33035 RepID=UPI002ED135FF